MIVDDYGNQVPAPAARGISQRLDEGDARMGRIEDDISKVRADLKTNTEATQAVAASTAEIVAFFQAMKGALKVLNWIGSWARPMAYLVGLGTALLSLWAAMKGHTK